MSRTALIALVGLMLVAPAAGRPVDDRRQPSSNRPYVSGELIVGFKEGVSLAQQRLALSGHSGKVTRRFGRIDGVLASVPATHMVEARRALERDPRVDFVEPNFVLRASSHGDPGDPGFHQLWGLHNFGQAVGGIPGSPDADIDALEAWQVSQGSSDVVVGVIDTGVDYTHPDLAAQMWTNPGEDCAGCRQRRRRRRQRLRRRLARLGLRRERQRPDGRQRPRDARGRDDRRQAGLQGVVGVAWRVRIMPLKFIGANGEGTAADALRAILYASSMGAQITNNSYGGDGFSQAMLDAIRTADSSGSLFVAAAGNDFSDNDEAPVYPAGYDAPNVISVAASDQFDRRAWFSNYGAAEVDLAAPGTNVYSTWPGGGYRHSDGTSMAAPHVAGAAALAKARFPAASGVGLKALLLRGVDDAGLEDAVRTGGRLNANTAVRCADRARVWLESPANGFEARAGDPLEIRVIATRCAEASGVSASLAVNGLPVELTPRGDGLYTGSYTPNAGAPLTVVASADAAGGSDTHSVSGMAVQHQSIEPGGEPVTVNVSAPGENPMLSFLGTGGRRIALKVSDVAVGSSPCCSLRISFLSVGGPEWLSPMPFGRNGGFIDTKTLPQDGVYRIIVDPQGSDVGSLKLTLYDVPPDVTGSISPGGPPVSTTTGPVPGQNALFSFSGLAGQRVSLKVSGVAMGTSTCCSANVSIPGLVGPTIVGTNGVFVDTKVLPRDGAFTILVDPAGMNVGSATLQLYDVPPDPVVSASPGGPPVTVSAGSVPGQNAVVQFAGSAGQRVAVRASGVTIGSSTCCSLKLGIVGARPAGADGPKRRPPRHGEAADVRDVLAPRRPARHGRGLGNAPDLRRPAGCDGLDHPGRRAADGEHELARPERSRDVRRPGRPASEPEAERRDDGNLDLLLGKGLDRKAGRLDPRDANPVRNERRLRRHEDPAGERHLHDPGRPVGHRHRLGHPPDVRSPARPDRLADGWRPAGEPDLHHAGPERSPDLRGHRRPASDDPSNGSNHRPVNVLLDDAADQEARRSPAGVRPSGHERRNPERDASQSPAPTRCSSTRKPLARADSA